jgi:hypothetical protein
MKATGSTTHNLVQEWTREWLAGTRSDTEAESRLRGMLEEVIWGNVVWHRCWWLGLARRQQPGDESGLFITCMFSSLVSFEYHILTDQCP